MESAAYPKNLRMNSTDEGRRTSHARRAAAPLSPAALAWLAAGWLLAGVTAGVRLHLAGGVFGERVPLGDSVVASLVNGAPWLFAAVVAWAAAAVLPVRRHDLLRPMTVHVAVGFAVVAGQQVLLMALRIWILPAELAPPDPVGQLVPDLVRWGPVALGVYAVLVGLTLWMRSPEAG